MKVRTIFRIYHYIGDDPFGTLQTCIEMRGDKTVQFTPWKDVKFGN